MEIPVNYSSRSFKEGKKVSFSCDPFVPASGHPINGVHAVLGIESVDGTDGFGA